MIQLFSREQITGYLSVHYVLSFRRSHSDFYYNHINRGYIPLPIRKNSWTKDELLKLFECRNVTYKPEIEFDRFIHSLK